MAWRSLLKGEPGAWLLEERTQRLATHGGIAAFAWTLVDPDRHDEQQRAMNTPPISPKHAFPEIAA